MSSWKTLKLLSRSSTHKLLSGFICFHVSGVLGSDFLFFWNDRTWQGVKIKLFSSLYACLQGFAVYLFGFRGNSGKKGGLQALARQQRAEMPQGSQGNHIGHEVRVCYIPGNFCKGEWNYPACGGLLNEI